MIDYDKIQLTTWERWLTKRKQFKTSTAMLRGKEISEGDVILMSGGVILGVVKNKYR